MSEIEKWLKDIHLEQYFPIFNANGFSTFNACAHLNDETLNSIGIDLPGHRKRILAHLPKENECAADVEYGNLMFRSPKESQSSDYSAPSDIPPPSNQCQTAVKPQKYLNMDRNSKVNVRVSQQDEEDSDTVYDIPPKYLRSCKSDDTSTSSDNDEYVPADPAPILPPKRSSKENIDAKLGITSPTMGNTSFAYANKSAEPPLVKPVRKLKDTGKISSSFDSGGGSVRERPVPKPRPSLQNKRPKPAPRERSFVQSKSEGSLKIPSDISEDISLITPTEHENTPDDSMQSICSGTLEKDDTLQPLQVSENAADKNSKPIDIGASNDCFEKSDGSEHEMEVKQTSMVDNSMYEAENMSMVDNNMYETKDTGMVDNNMYETKHTSMVDNNIYETEQPSMVDNSLYETKPESVSQGASFTETSESNASSNKSPSSPSFAKPDGLERIVIGAELTKEESDNLANEILYVETKVPRLKVDDIDERASYAGLWDMRSGSEKIPVNEVKPFMRKDVRLDVGDRSSFNDPPPAHSPPPLPRGFQPVRKPSVDNLPVAPGPPPLIPPRPGSGSQRSSASKRPELTPPHAMQSNVISELTKKQATMHSSLSDTEDMEACPVYSSADSVKTLGTEQNKDTVTPKSSMKKPPTPPPKIDNPFKDMYDPNRGTYCLEGASPDFTSPQASGWESEDTLSDGGDFLDEEETELSIDVRRSTLQRMSSIPIISVTKSRILERTGYLYKKSSGKSEGNPIKGSYKAITRWQKRWVDFDSINLTYYATNKSQISNRIIPASSIINVEQDIRQGETHPFQFILRTVDRTYTFAAEDANNLSMWTSLIMSTVLEQAHEFQEGGDMHHPNKQGFVKMEGAKGKRYIAMKGEKFCYYNAYSDFKAGSPIHTIEMKLASVKDIGRNKLQMHTPYAPYVLLFETSDELLSWKGALEEAIAEGLGDNSVLEEVYENHSNRLCADCGAPDPHWASVNLGITLCKWCAGIHRNLSIPTSKVRSLRMDLKIWSAALKQFYKKVGNDEANNFWEWNAIDENKIDSDVDMNLRQDYITTKYKIKKFVRYHPLKGDKKALNEALCKSVQYEDVAETMQLLFSGADILYVSEHYKQQTPLEIAKENNQTIQMEFLYQNGGEGSGELPVIYSPTALAPRLPLPSSVTHKGHLYKTGSNVKREFLKRWVVLEHNIMSYYESETKSQAKDSIQKDEMLSVTLTTDDRMQHTFELATLKDRGRVYLFGAETESDRAEWMSALSKTITTAPQDKWTGLKGISRGGVVHIKQGSSATYKKMWMQVTKKTIKIFNESTNEFSEIDLRRIKSRMMLKESVQICENAMERGTPFVLDLPNEAFYIQADLKKETEEWFRYINKLCEGGGTLSEQLLTRDNIPVIVDKCICYVELHGLTIEGIYRLNGQHSKVSKLLSDFSKDASGVHPTEEEYQVHDVSTTLKRFFRNLEDPLMSRQLYPRWIQAASQSDSDIKLQQYVQLLEELPPLNKCTLEKVIRHLHRVAENETENKMSIINIASIFGPIMLNTTQDPDTPSQGFASTNQEICVLKDLLENQQFYFQMNTLDRQMEKRILDAMKRMEVARNVAVPSVANEMLLSIHVRNKDDPEVVTHRVPPAMTAQELLSYVMKKRKLKASENWGLYEIICNEEMERPVHFSEKVLEVTMKWSKWPSEFCKDNHLCVKRNFVYDQIEVVYDSNFSLFGELRCSEKKQFKKYAFEFSQCKLSYHKRDAKAMVQLGSWNVEDLIIYVGTQHDRRPPNKWAFTFIQQGQDLVKSRDCPFFGHTVCCNNQEELYRWIAAMLRAQKGPRRDSEPKHPQGLQPRAEAGATSDNPSQVLAKDNPEMTSMIELTTQVPAGGASGLSDRPQHRSDKTKSKFINRLLNR